MCGIAGFLASNGSADTSLVERMVAQLAHRGPDGNGVATSANGACTLGHARLAIVDLSERGRQPFVSENGTLLLTCNGEIYNYPDLRRSLEQQGHVFRSDCDSEVILHLYQRHGTDCLDHLDGMFAFALYDATTGTLFCARDPVGKKPLAYTEVASGFAFSSELPALFDVPGADLNADPQAIGLYMLRNLRHFPEPWTFYRGLRRLRPGYAMTVRGGRVDKQWRYWTPRFDPEAVTPEDILTRFDEAVDKRRMADVEIGALLSGGIDSSAIVDELVRLDDSGIRTYAFGGTEDDEELERARFMADRLGTRHRSFVFDAARHHDHFDKLLALHGEPVMALPLTHAYGLFETIREDGLKVVMTGHGADEVFYGYDGAHASAALARLTTLMPGGISALLGRGLTVAGSGRMRDAGLVLGSTPGKKKAALYKDEAGDIWPQILSSDALSVCNAAAVDDWLSPVFGDRPPEEFIDEAAFAGLMTENAHAVTIAGDLPAMAHGIEVRCPFLDRTLLETALRTPYERKVGKVNGTPTGKIILKDALSGRLPAEVLSAPKRGFGYHVQEDEVLRGAWKEQVDDAFSDMDGLGGLLNADGVRSLKSAFDRRAGIPAITIAKLYALHRCRTVLDSTPTGAVH